MELLGDCDRIINQLCLMLESDSWSEPIHQDKLLQHTGMPDIEPPADKGKDEKKEGKDGSNKEQKDVIATEGTTENSVEKHEEPVVQEPNQGDKNCENQNEENNSDDEGEDFKIKSLSDYIPDGHFLFLSPSR